MCALQVERFTKQEIMQGEKFFEREAGQLVSAYGTTKFSFCSILIYSQRHLHTLRGTFRISCTEGARYHD